MKNKKQHLAGGIIGLTICIASAIVAQTYPALTFAAGALAVLSIIAFLVSVSRWLSEAFAAEAGVALSEYVQWLYGGRWDKGK